MEPITLIVNALVAGATAGLTSVAEETLKDAYAGLKALIVRKFGSKRAVPQAIDFVEEDPEAAGRKEFLKGELEAAGADKDAQVLQAAKDLLALLQPEETVDNSQTAIASEGSAAATGRGIATVGDGNISLAGDVQGSVTIGSTPKGDE